MSISDRYRELVVDAQAVLAEMTSASGEEEGRELREVRKATEGISELYEAVGEIPRIRLEADLTPVLLKAHNQLDRARLLLEEQGAADRAAGIWELEQKIYRLLNDL